MPRSNFITAFIDDSVQQVFFQHSWDEKKTNPKNKKITKFSITQSKAPSTIILFNHRSKSVCFSNSKNYQTVPAHQKDNYNHIQKHLCNQAKQKQHKKQCTN